MSGSVEAMSDSELEPTQWKIFGERLVDENPFIRLSIASVGLPDGTKFEQYAMRMRRTATTAVVNDQGQVLLMVSGEHERAERVGADLDACPAKVPVPHEGLQT
jgi:hypothetical protein